MYEQLRPRTSQYLFQFNGIPPRGEAEQKHGVPHWQRRNQDTNVRPARHLYKPPAVRLISLTIFLVVFAGCIGLIEWIISDTTAQRTDSAVTKSPTVGRRELTTITSYDSPISCLTQTEPFTTCASLDIYKSQLQSAEDVWSKLCSIYSTSFEPYKNRFPSSLQNIFTSWTNAYSEQQITRTIAAGKVTGCTRPPLEACTSESSLILNSTLRKTTEVTIGCSLSTMIGSPPCWARGSYLLQSGSITSMSIMVCGAKTVSQILITTNVSPHTSPTSIAQQGNTASPTLAPPTSTPVQVKPASSVSTVSPTPAPSSVEEVINEVSTPPPTSIHSEVLVLSSASPLAVSTSVKSSSVAPALIMTSAAESLSAVSSSAASSVAASSSAVSMLVLSSSVTSPLAASSSMAPQLVASQSPASSSMAAQVAASQSVASTTVVGVVQPSSKPVSTSSSVASTNNTRDIIQSTNTQVPNSEVSGTRQTNTMKTSTKALTSVSATSTQSNSATTGNPSVNFTLSTYEVIVQRRFTYVTYFSAVFLPALIAVVLKALWSIVASSLKMIEPFQRLSGGESVTAAYSLLTQYLEGMISGDVIRSLIRGRVLPICSLLIYAMVEILPLIASISMNVRTRDMCLYQGEYRPCDPVWVIDLPLTRTLEALLFFCIALVICLIWLTRKSYVPVTSNPSSIISLAALLNYEPLLASLQRIDPDADGKLYSAALGKKVYCLTEHYDPKSKRTRFGFVSSQPRRSPGDQDHSGSHLLGHARNNTHDPHAPVNHRSDPNESQIMARRSRFSPISRMWIRTALHLLTTVGLLVIIMTYLLDTNLDDSFNRFFNGDSVPPIVSKTVFVGLAIIVDMQMKNLERTIRITDPFRRLALRNARAETTILLPLNGTCWSNFPKNLYLMCRYEFSQGRMAWITAVSFVACLSDANIIAVAGFLFNEAQTRESYYVCAYMSMACTSAILLTILITMAWWLRVPVIRRMPRHPDTIGNILSYLCGSEIVRDWNSIGAHSIPVEDMSREERDALVVHGGRRFCFGRMLGMDERERWSIDYEREYSQVMVVDNSSRNVPQRTWAT